MPDNSPAKRNAYRKVHAALKSGILVRPESCQICGAIPRKGKDGRSLIQGHHHKGYEFPLDVQWMCVSCHSDHTPRAVGESNPRAKLSDADVAKIRAMIGKWRKEGLALPLKHADQEEGK